MIRLIRAYFVSDLHLGVDCSAEERRREEKIFDFFKEIADEVTHLYIAGDLFDFWYEYKKVIPKKYFNFLHILKSLSEKGVEIHYLAGNHDFFLGSFFDDTLNIKTWQDEYAFELGGKKFFLQHGDGLAKRDKSYRILRRILRGRVNNFLFRWIHPDLGIPLARFVSGSSRSYSRQLSLQDENDYKEFAENRFAEGYDYVLLGHRHIPLEYKKDGHLYINLGEWFEKNSYALFDGRELKLKYFK
jgi:UDP-2,3-diacylglucosamine hydrolase